jgi:hypothetical protein
MTQALDRLVNTDRILNHLVQVRDRSTGGWTTVKTVEPRYLWTESILVHHFLVWKWETIRTKVRNIFDGGRRCRREAVRVALAIAADNPGSDIRVVRTYKFAKDESSSQMPIWRNGEWKDC